MFSYRVGVFLLDRDVPPFLPKVPESENSSGWSFSSADCETSLVYMVMPNLRSMSNVVIQEMPNASHTSGILIFVLLADEEVS